MHTFGVVLLASVSVFAVSSAGAFANEPIEPGGSDDTDWSVSEEPKGYRHYERRRARLIERLRRTNRPPVADLTLVTILPGLVKLDASASFDRDGYIQHYTFALFDAVTGESIASPVTSREPFGDIFLPGGLLPEELLASVVVEDDQRATDTDAFPVAIPGGQTNCSGNASFTCSLIDAGPATACNPASSITQFTAEVLLGAAQGCTASLNADTSIIITAAGGSGGSGADVWPAHGGGGGKGGAARLKTTVDDLNTAYGDGAAYCYGIGANGSHGDTHSGAGGAATLLRTCENASQTEVTGVLAIGGGGGAGGAAGAFAFSGAGGGQGGITLSNTSGNTGAGGHKGGSAGALPGGLGGSGGTGGDAGGGGGGAKGHDGVGGKGGASDDWGTAGFVQGNPLVTGSTGQGGTGTNSGGGGAGGGGYGGGGSGIIAVGDGASGGGGGGSFAAKSSRSTSGDPAPAANSGRGYLVFEFYP